MIWIHILSGYISFGHTSLDLRGQDTEYAILHQCKFGILTFNNSQDSELLRSLYHVRKIYVQKPNASQVRKVDT